MKAFLSIIQLLALSSSIFCQQCPPFALKIQSPLCDTPQDIKSVTTCVSAKLNWKGNKDQRYIVQAIVTDDAANTLSDTKAADYSCNENGNCSATIAVKENERVNWNVQAVCNMNGAIIYSPVVQGTEVVIPSCRLIAGNNEDINKNNSGNLKVYPNPTTGYLTVELGSKVKTNIKFTVVDVNGKKVFDRFGNVVSSINNNFQLDLHALSSGTYILEVRNGQEINRIKFEMLRD
jgi:hypothetical protein